MNKDLSGLEKTYAEEELQKINQLEKKIDTTKYNIKLSSEIIAETPL